MAAEFSLATSTFHSERFEDRDRVGKEKFCNFKRRARLSAPMKTGVLRRVSRFPVLRFIWKRP